MAGMDAVTRVPEPINEPILQYAPGSAERAELEGALKDLASAPRELTSAIGGKRVMASGERLDIVQPHARHAVLGTTALGTTDDAAAAVAAAAAAAAGWRELSFDDRAAILLKAADLLAGPWRARLNAATMLGQSKTAIQAEIDAACELIDFWRFNVAFARRSSRSSRSRAAASGTAPTTARSRASSTRSRRSTSPPSPATCPPPRP